MGLSSTSYAGNELTAANPPIKDGKAFVLPEIPRTSQDNSVLVSGFRFDGNTVFTSEELSGVLSEYLGKHIARADLGELSRRITLYYVEHGYINSGALLTELPQSQNYPGNIVPLRVIEGRVSEVRMHGEGGLRSSYIRDRLVRDGEPLNMNVLQQRFSLLLNDPLIAKINSRVIPGEELGSAILDLDITRNKPYSLNLYANNYQAPSIGSEAIGASFTARNLSGWGDSLELGLQHSRGNDPIHLGWSTPLGARGTHLHISADNGQASVIEEPLNTIDIRSRSKAYEVGINQDLIDTPQRKVNIGLGYVRRESRTTLLGEPYSFTAGEPDGDSLIKAWRLSQDWTERWDKQALALRSVFVFGRTNVTQDAESIDVPDSTYNLWNGQFQFVRDVSDRGAQVVIHGSTQLSSHRLLPLERYVLGGSSTVRGYRENAVVRDQGEFLSFEYHYPIWAAGDATKSLQLIPFMDLGNAHNKDEASQRLSSAGVGISWHQYGIKADLFLAKAFSKLAVDTHGNLQDHGVHFQISYDAL